MCVSYFLHKTPPNNSFRVEKYTQAVRRQNKRWHEHNTPKHTTATFTCKHTRLKAHLTVFSFHITGKQNHVPTWWINRARHQPTAISLMTSHYHDNSRTKQTFRTSAAGQMFLLADLDPDHQQQLVHFHLTISSNELSAP